MAVQTRSVVREIEIDGAQRVSAKRLRKEITLKINAPVNEEQLEQGRQKIIETYKGRGYNDVSVQFRVDPIEEGRGTSRVVYTVNEGIKGAVRSVRFEGYARADGLWDIEAHLTDIKPIDLPLASGVRTI